MPNPRSAPRGFSLIEVMVVIAIAGIMSAIAVVSLRDVVTANVENGTARSVAALIKRARVLAISNHNRVKVVLVATPNTMNLQSCRAVYGGNATCANSETLTDVIQSTFAFGKGDMKGVVVSGPSEGTALIFDSAGFPENTSTTYTFVVDHAGRPGVRKVVVSAAGEVRVK